MLNQSNVKMNKNSKTRIFVISSIILAFIVFVLYALIPGVSSIIASFTPNATNSEVKKISLSALENLYDGEYVVKSYYNVNCDCIDTTCASCNGGIILKDSLTNKKYDIKLYKDDSLKYIMNLNSCVYTISLKRGWANWYKKDIIDHIDSSCFEK